MAGTELTMVPTAGSTIDQVIGMPIAQVVSGFTRRAGRKERRTQDVITALVKRDEELVYGSAS